MERRLVTPATAATARATRDFFGAATSLAFFTAGFAVLVRFAAGFAVDLAVGFFAVAAAGLARVDDAAFLLAALLAFAVVGFLADCAFAAGFAAFAGAGLADDRADVLPFAAEALLALVAGFALALATAGFETKGAFAGFA